MSDFKRKIEIVESTTPPPNKYNWWFDLNEQKLKRFNSGEWVEYNTKPEIVVPMPKDNEIWFQLQYDANDYRIEQSEINDFVYGSLNRSIDDLERYEQLDHVLKLVFNTQIDSLENVELQDYSITGANLIMAVKLPKLAYIGTDMGNIVVNIPTIIMQEILDVEDYALDCDTLICLAETPPVIGLLEDYNEDVGEGIEHVYVQDSAIDKYKGATNWSSLNIKELSSLDKSVYNWG